MWAGEQGTPGDITVRHAMWPPLPTYTHHSLSTCRGQTSKITHQVVIILQTIGIPSESKRLTLQCTHWCDCSVNCALNQVLGCQLLTLHIKLSTSTLALNFYQSLPFKGKPFVNCTSHALLGFTTPGDLNVKTRVQSKKCSHSPDLCVHFMTIEMMVSGCILRL